MSPRFDVVVIGGGPDAMVAATVLAKAGRRVHMLAREAVLGGLHRPFEFSPGYKAPLSMEADWVPDPVLRALDLDVAFDSPRIPASVALPDGGFLPLSMHAGDAAAAISPHFARDAERWPDFLQSLHDQRAGAVRMKKRFVRIENDRVGAFDAAHRFASAFG